MLNEIRDVVIVGAGIAGLSAYRTLADQGRSLWLIEKSRGAGGRMATRRAPDWRADLGAQFTAARNPEWRAAIQRLGDHVREVKVEVDSTHARYVHAEGMNRLARGLLSPKELEQVHFSTRATAISIPKDPQQGWVVRTEPEDAFIGRSLILTAPAPQSWELLSSSAIECDPLAVQAISRLSFSPCLALVILLDEPSHQLYAGTRPAIAKKPGPDFEGIYDQRRKGLRTDSPVLVAHASVERSRSLWNADNETAMAAIHADFMELVSRQIGPGLVSRPVSFHRWRYCEPEVVHPNPFLEVTRGGRCPILLAGDAFGTASIDGAFTSGREAAHFLDQVLA